MAVRRGGGTTTTVSGNNKNNDRQLETRLLSSIVANASHGFGHLFLLALGGPPPAMELSWKLEAMAYWLVLLCFWTGVLKNLLPNALPTYKRAVILSVAVLFVQYILSVPPELAFTYSQSVILFGGSLDQLATSHKKNFTYLAISASMLPLFVFYAMEMTACQRWAVPGHALYDYYLAAQPFLLHAVVVQWHEGSGYRLLLLLQPKTKMF
jgi:hypothetical protein